MLKKCIAAFLAALVMTGMLSCMTAGASGVFAAYDSYEYNMFGEPVVAPVGYTLKSTLDGARLGLDSEMSAPTDIVYTGDTIYILDSENSRIITLNENYELIREYTNFTISGELAEQYGVILTDGFVTFNGAKGMAITPDGEILIADTNGDRILRATQDCEIVSVILRPDEALNNTSALFQPSKVAVDDKGRIYVTSSNIALGLMVFSPEGEFLEFYGANEVLSNTQAFVKFFRDIFLSVTQLDLVEQATPVSITNMDFAPNGFMYIVSPYRGDAGDYNAAVAGLVRKLNYLGDDLYDETMIFGDIEESSDGRKTWFHDVDIDENGFINLLDNDRGRVFQYTDAGILVSVFGTNSDQAGGFGNATALESVNGDILVVDLNKDCVFVFEPTEYVDNVRQAVLLMNNNDLEGSQRVWNDLLRSNSNSYLCYDGLGRISDYEGEYTQAMAYYKRAYNQEDYALAFQQQRQILVEQYAVYIALGLLAVIVLIAIGLRFLRRLAVPAEGEAYSRLEGKYTLPLFVLTHPADGFSQFKTRRITSMRVSTAIVLLWVVIKILEYNCTGFAFSINRAVDFNMLVTLFVTAGLFLLFVVANWAICTLLDGKGTFRDIVSTTAYSLIPYLVSQVIKIPLTNVLVPAESVFIQIITVIGVLWSAALLIVGMLTIHEFSFGKTVWTLILTLLGMFAMVFLAVLLYSLMRQVFSFVTSVYKEIQFRF